LINLLALVFGQLAWLHAMALDSGNQDQQHLSQPSLDLQQVERMVVAVAEQIPVVVDADGHLLLHY
jgi:hypothetical protein